MFNVAKNILAATLMLSVVLFAGSALLGFVSFANGNIQPLPWFIAVAAYALASALSTVFALALFEWMETVLRTLQKMADK